MSARTISFVKGKGNINHNNREFTTKNVDKELTKNNVIFKQEPIEEAYKKCFGQAIEDYNSKQKRNDRKINDYMEQISHSKNGEKPFYENVVQIGDMHDTNVRGNDAEACKKALTEYADTFQERNPNLYVFNMVLHMDEQTPHLHIDYIPVAEGYNKGLAVRNSLTKAFENMGIEQGSGKKDNSTMHWQTREREHINEICERNKIQTKEIGIQRDNFTLDEYRVLTDELKKELKDNPVKSIEKKPALLAKGKVIVNEVDLKELEKRAKVAKAYREAMEKATEEAKKIKNELSAVKSEYKAKVLEVDVERKNLSVERSKYSKAYNNQLTLNERFNSASELLKDKNLEIGSLKTEIESLKAEVNQLNKTMLATISEQIQTKTNEFDKKMEEVAAELSKAQEKAKGAYQSLTNSVKAMNLFECNGEYHADLSEKQKNLFQAIRDYSSHWLKKDGFEELSQEVKKKGDISKGINDFIPDRYKEIIYYKGSKGYGFYSSKAEGAEYLGSKNDFELLREEFPSAKFKDPGEHIQAISGMIMIH